MTLQHNDLELLPEKAQIVPLEV